MVVVAQLVRASVCGTESRRFEPGLPPKDDNKVGSLRRPIVSVLLQLGQ